MRIYPSAPGLVVRDPVKRDTLPDAGREVPDDDLYWQRRLADDDVSLKPFEPVTVQHLDELAEPGTESMDEGLADALPVNEPLDEGDDQ